MHEEFIEHAPRQESYLEFMFMSLGWRYTFLLPLVTLISFVLILVLVIRGKGSLASAALVLIVPLPILVGMMGVVDGMLASFQGIAMSDVTPKPSDWAVGISTSLMTAWVGTLLAIPGYMLAVVGSSIRSLVGDPAPSTPGGAIQATIVESKR